MVEVFWGITASRGGYARIIPADRSVMISAAGLWKGDGRWMQKRVWPWRRWMLDSGGYTMFTQFSDYQFKPDEYLRLVKERKPSYAASMDYPCEPQLTSEISGAMTVEERIRAGADMAFYLCRRSDRIFPVLQGWTRDDYELSWRLTEPLRPRMVGVGSLCVRQGTKAIKQLVFELRHMLPIEVWKHGFGVKITALRDPVVRGFFTSVDTNAWEYWGRYQRHKHITVTDRDAWIHYSKRLDSLADLPTQTLLPLGREPIG